MAREERRAGLTGNGVVLGVLLGAVLLAAVMMLVGKPWDHPKVTGKQLKTDQNGRATLVFAPPPQAKKATGRNPGSTAETRKKRDNSPEGPSAAKSDSSDGSVR